MAPHGILSGMASSAARYPSGQRGAARRPPAHAARILGRTVGCGAHAALLLGLVVGCGARSPTAIAPAPSRTDSPSGVRYVFTLDRELDTMHASVCFTGGLPDRLVPIHVEGRRRLIRAEARSGTSRRPLPRDSDIDLRGLSADTCIEYEADLASRARLSGAGSVRVGGDRIAPTSLWLWAPDRMRAGCDIRARFELPPGVRASTLWPSEEDGTLRLDASAFRYLAYVAFGSFAIERIPVPGGCLEAAVLDGSLEADADSRRRWLATAGRAVARIDGSFPARRAGVIVMPIAQSEVPVLFGIVGRGMLPTIALLAGERADPAALLADWTAVHELAHLLSPYVEREEAWITEGLATYYQQILRAREQMIPELVAWREMIDGFARGRREGTGRTLREASRNMGATAAYGRVYWAGAAIALLADVELRRRGSSLDAAMRRALPRRNETMSAAELVRAMDGEDGGAIAEVVARWIDSAEFPDTAPALDWLGVGRSDSGVALDPRAPGASVRAAIVNDLRPLASEPASCEP